MQFQPVIRWSGGKRRQSEDIIDQFPNRMDTLWIPFLGGGSIMFQAIHSNIKYKRIVVSDIYDTLMGIWDLIKNDPKKLLDGYAELVAKQDKDRKFYDEAVYEFNVSGGTDPIMLYFITRCTTRGNTTFDRYGNFDARMSESDSPSRPNIVDPIVMRWHESIQDVEFRCEPYNAIADEVQPGDYVFMDPPYIDGTWYKHHNMDWDGFWEFCRNLPCDYSITLNGDKEAYPIPQDLYTKHMYIYYGVTTTSSGNKAGIRDSLWVNARSGIYTGSKNSRANGRPGGGASNNVTDDAKALFEMNDRINKIESDVADIKNMFGSIMEAIKK